MVVNSTSGLKGALKQSQFILFLNCKCPMLGVLWLDLLKCQEVSLAWLLVVHFCSCTQYCASQKAAVIVFPPLNIYL